MDLTVCDVARMIDLSAVRTDVDEAEIRALVETAKLYQCICVFGMPCYTPEIKALLQDEQDILVGGVVGFPSGADSTTMKAVQARELARIGCDELDMVINVGWLRSGRYRAVGEDIRAVVDAAGGLPVKVILEVAYLTDDQIRKGSELCISGGAEFVKTGTGWAGHPTTLEHIKLIRSTVGDAVKIKAAGGIRSLKTIADMYRLGVSRFGIGLQSGRRILEECAGLPGGVLVV